MDKCPDSADTIAKSISLLSFFLSFFRFCCHLPLKLAGSFYKVYNHDEEEFEFSLTCRSVRPSVRMSERICGRRRFNYRHGVVPERLNFSHSKEAQILTLKVKTIFNAIDVNILNNIRLRLNISSICHF